MPTLNATAYLEHPLTTAFNQVVAEDKAERQRAIELSESKLNQYISDIMCLKTFASTNSPGHLTMLTEFEKTDKLDFILENSETLTPLIKALAELQVAISQSENAQQQHYYSILINAMNLLIEFTNIPPLDDSDHLHNLNEVNLSLKLYQMKVLTTNLQAATEFVKAPSDQTRTKLMNATADTVSAYDEGSYIHKNRLIFGFVGAVLLTLSVALVIAAAPSTALLVFAPASFVFGASFLYNSLNPIRADQKPAYALEGVVKQVCQFGVFNSARAVPNTVQNQNESAPLISNNRFSRV